MSSSADLNELSDEALRLALARALERNAHLEGLVVSIGERVNRLDRFRLQMSAAQYAALSYEHESEDAYLEDQEWVLAEREKQGDEEEPYPMEHECPFFTERFLYGLFGKDDARTIIAMFRQIERLATEDDAEMNRRRERKKDIVITARGLLSLKDDLERIDKYLDPDETWMKHRTKTTEELQADREEILRRMLSSAERMAEYTSWFTEDW